MNTAEYIVVAAVGLLIVLQLQHMSGSDPPKEEEEAGMGWR